MPKTIFTGANQILVQALKEERIRANLTQGELARRLGRDQSWISLVEGSQRRVDVIEFIEVAEALDVDPVELLREIIGKIG